MKEWKDKRDVERNKKEIEEIEIEIENDTKDKEINRK